MFFLFFPPESWSNFIAQYTRVHEGTQYTLSSSSTLIIFLWVQSVQRDNFCNFFFLPFVCQSVEDLPSPHLIRLLVLCWAAKNWTDCADCALHAGHVWFFLCLKMSFLSDDSSMIFIHHLRRFTFLGHHQKSDRTFLPLMQWTLGISAVLKCEPRLTVQSALRASAELERGSAQKRLHEMTHTPLTAFVIHNSVHRTSNNSYYLKS